jgi:septum site-determining protein MinC
MLKSTSKMVGNEALAEIKSGQFQHTIVRIKSADAMAVADYLREQISRAPNFYAGAAVAVDLSPLQGELSGQQCDDLFEAIRATGLTPFALMGSQFGAVHSLAKARGIPVLSEARARGKNAKELAQDMQAAAIPMSPQRVVEPVRAKAPEPAPTVVATTAATKPVDELANGGPMVYQAPVRSGQQLYARGRDLVVIGPVSAGAEVAADGSIHIYGRLIGKALAGAKGNTDARIFCTVFGAELVSIAGNYKLLENVPSELRGRSVQIALTSGKLTIEPLG